MLSIVQVYDWPTTVVEEMLVESEQEGFRFLRRAQGEWRSGSNTFSKAGEALFAVFEAQRLLALGGVNRESDRCGRLRRFYVRREERRRGVGTQLVLHLVAFSRRYYSCLELRCDTDAGDRFYRALGFTRSVTNASVTHKIDLNPEPNQSLQPNAGAAPVADEALPPRG
jgi:GNAT superfamily N-acetyltransferase